MKNDSFFGLLLKNKIIILCILSFFAITAIALMKEALELEDAEQAYYSQWFRWGYDDQPPLYTWVQYAINQVFGISRISFSLLRGAIFFGILFVLHRFAKSILKDTKKSELAVLCLALVPVFIDFTFRRLSHTALLTLVLVFTYWIIHRLLQKGNFGNYVILGLVMGVGILSKYNYGLFLAALGVSLFFDRELRKVFLNKYILVSVTITLLMIIPHFHWLLTSGDYLLELKQSVSTKMESNDTGAIFLITPFFSFLQAIFRLFLPVTVLLGLLVFLKKLKLKPAQLDWFSKLFFAQLLVLLLFFLLGGVNKIEVRWLMPLFLPFSVLLIRYFHFKNPAQLSKYGFYLFLGILSLQMIRTPIERLFGIPSSVHFGFHPIAKKLENNYPDKQWILPNVTYGGNIRLLVPDREIFSADDFSIPKAKLNGRETVEVFESRETLEARTATDSLPSFGKEHVTLYFLVN